MISKSDQKIIQGNSCYTLVQTLLTDNQHATDEEFLKEVINSSYHFWQGDQFPDGITWTFSDERGQDIEYKNVKTFGFYDNNDIRPTDYSPIDIETLKNRLSSFILEETDDKDYELKILNLVQAYEDRTVTVYQFVQDDRLQRSQFSVYDCFISFILLDKVSNKAIRIEFGQD